MRALHEYVTEEQLRRLRAGYNRKEMLAALGAPLPTLLPRSREYIDAIEHAFYPKDGADSVSSPEPFTLSIRERELCLIVLLSTHHSQHNLAVHIYLGLMEGISPQEIGNLLLLNGVYSGVPAFANGLRTAAMTLIALARAATENTAEPADNPLNPVAILERLKAVFPYV
jgi:alkylhydroperoxidase/carboxymuconolactone decarboxylase family protein YurZ